VALPVGAHAWRDTALGLPAGGRWRELFTGVMIEPAAHDHGWALPVADALARLPVACLERVGS
jgi:maltooligosyltrehalose synthase